MELGICPERWFRLSKARLSILSRPKFRGISPQSLLFRRSKCIKLEIFVIEGGIVPEIRLSATLRTVSLVSLPISAGISPEILFPIRSKIRRKGSEVIQSGISPEIPFQSATVKEERRVSLQIAGEMYPVMYPVR
ncbi:hypothetical protein RGQ29_001935 [Quercus rubra]|uniref:Uncharacterized protein n=1 Tax=Quercus rubra TaxID=3512 RepID=A0AAN7JED6_QUERU|nr:hypothetical protein RGQ29_001935 [Quercus rubra]